MIVRLAWFRNVRFFLMACLGGTFLADWLFYNHSLGANLVVFHLFVLLLALVQTPAALRTYFPLVVLLAGLLIAMAAQPGPLIVALFWAGVVAFIFAARRGWTNNTLEWLSRWMQFLFSVAFGILRDLLLIRKCRNSGHGKPIFRNGERAIANWTLPAVGSIVFFALFYTANPVLSYWVATGMLWVEKLMGGFVLSPPRILFWCSSGVLLWALCRVRPRAHRHFRDIGAGRMLSPSLLVRCLGLFNAVFAVQTILDAFYLWGGTALPPGMTYAEYAHRGAYPLIATALLAGAFVLVTFRAGLPTQQTALARKLVILWLSQNVLLTLNSLWRLHLYVEVYSLTRLRVAAALWMALVAFGLVLLAWRIYAGKSNGWLLNANFVSLLAMLYLCAFLNFDAWISRYNVEHAREITGKGVSLDITYLEREIGVEAIPALIWFYQNTSIPYPAAKAMDATQKLMSRLNRDLSGWRSRTIRKTSLKEEIIHGPGDARQEKRVSLRFAVLSVL